MIITSHPLFVYTVVGQARWGWRKRQSVQVLATDAYHAIMVSVDQLKGYKIISAFR